MAAVEVFDAETRAALARALDHAGRTTGLKFSLRVGTAEGAARPYACRLHADRGPEAADTVLIFVDPAGRRLEIVTGSRARRRVDDALCGRAAAAMTPLFAQGDLGGGVLAGLAVLGEKAAPAARTKKAGAGRTDRPESQSTLF